MSALLAGLPGRGEDAFDRARAELDLQGIGVPRMFASGDARVLWYPGYGDIPEDDACLTVDDGFIVCVGTLFFRNRTGEAALRALWADFTEPGRLQADDPWGNYAIAIARRGRLWLFTDRLGMVKLYERPAASIVSTSWLACVAAGPESSPDRIGALDYVLSGANHGDRTPVAQVRIVAPTLAMEFASGERHALSTPGEWFAHAPLRSLTDAVDEAVALLQDRGRAIHEAFDGRIRCALSGGFDSRLLLATQRSVGERPLLHVYGAPDAEDVGIARTIAAGIGMPLRHVDKARAATEMPALTAGILDERMRFFDGIPTDSVFDLGPDRDTRLAQSADGAIALNGGGGEVLRNFFYLRDREFAIEEVVQTFYANHDPALFRRAGDFAEYAHYLAESMSGQIGHGGRLSRTEVEALYPLFRGRFWTSRNNSMAARCGHFLTPLLDPAFVRFALAIPLGWKDYGRFEGRLIAALDPELGAYPLSYGFRPDLGPPPRYVAKMWLQHRRPPWLRARSVRLKRLVGRLPPPAIPPGIDALLPGPRRIAELLDVSRLTDRDQVERALTLDYALRALKVRCRARGPASRRTVSRAPF